MLNTNVFVGSGEAVVQKIETTSPPNAVIHGDGDDLRVGLTDDVFVVANDGNSVDGVDDAANGEFDRVRFQEQIQDLGFVRELSNLAFESFERDYDHVESSLYDDLDDDDDELIDELASDLAFRLA